MAKRPGCFTRERVLVSVTSFAMLYRWKVEAAHQEAFRRRWRAITMDLRDHHGGLGSCLAQDDEGNFVAFARWPSEEVRNRAIGARNSSSPLPGIIEFEQTSLSVVDDLLGSTSGGESSPGDVGIEVTR